jgi:hypothetical protein
MLFIQQKKKKMKKMYSEIRNGDKYILGDKNGKKGVIIMLKELLNSS